MISKADEIFVGVEYFKEGLENQVEGCNVVTIQTEPTDFEAHPLQPHCAEF